MAGPVSPIHFVDPRVGPQTLSEAMRALAHVRHFDEAAPVFNRAMELVPHASPAERQQALAQITRRWENVPYDRHYIYHMAYDLTCEGARSGAEQDAIAAHSDDQRLHGLFTFHKPHLRYDSFGG